MQDRNGKVIDTNSKKFLWKQRIGFGISDFACNIAYIMVNTYLLIFYTDVAGLATGAVATLFLVTKIFDAFTDYMVGRYIDRTNTKMGRNRPWMLAGIPVLAVGMVLVFTTPDLSATGKLVWAYATYILFSFGYTMVNIPMTSIVPSLSPNPAERTNITTVKAICSSLGSLTSASLAAFLLVRLSGGNAATGYLRTNLLFALVVIIVLLISVFSIQEINPPAVHAEKTGILTDLRFCAKNKPYMLMIALVFIYFFGYLGMYAAMAYYFTYIVGNAQVIGAVVSLLTITGFFGMLGVSVLNRRFYKRNIMMSGLVLQLAGFAALLISESTFYIGLTIYGVGGGLISPCLFAMLADTFDYGEHMAEKSLAGTQTAFVGFASKVASAFASAAIAALLGFGGYVANAEVQTAGALNTIKFVYIGIPIACSVIGMGIMYFYDLDKRYAQIKVSVDKKRKDERDMEAAVELNA